MLCDSLEGWEGVGEGRGFKREETCVYQWLICVDVWQKPTQYCKAIILQLKINKLKKRKWVVLKVDSRSYKKGLYGFTAVWYIICELERIIYSTFLVLPESGFLDFSGTRVKDWPVRLMTVMTFEISPSLSQYLTSTWLWGSMAIILNLLLVSPCHFDFMMTCPQSIVATPHWLHLAALGFLLEHTLRFLNTVNQLWPKINYCQYVCTWHGQSYLTKCSFFLYYHISYSFDGHVLCIVLINKHNRILSLSVQFSRSVVSEFL